MNNMLFSVPPIFRRFLPIVCLTSASFAVNHCGSGMVVYIFFVATPVHTNRGDWSILTRLDSKEQVMRDCR